MNEFKKYLLSIAVGLSGLTLFNSRANAVTCLAPHPLCIVVEMGLLIGLLKGGQGGEVNPVLLAEDRESLQSLNEELKNAEFGVYIIRIADHYKNGPYGLKQVVTRYQKGKISGDWGLEFLYDFNKTMFKDLDKLEAMMAESFGLEKAQSVYGPKTLSDGSINWQRYASLAQDAMVLWENSFEL